MPEIPDLECHGLTKSFGDFKAVRDVSFVVPPGSFFSILGPSGCGKTTLLRMIAGFQSPDSGDLIIKGNSVLHVPPNKRPVSMVFQHLALFPMMNIGANVGFGLRQRGVNKADIKTQVKRVLERVGLAGVAERSISSLSGGQKQRVAIARCMVLEPDVLLLDEPLGALDLKLREHMKVELKQLQTEFNTTFVYITHDQSEALVMSDKIAVMNNGEFEQVGTARELYYEPDSAFVAGFIGEANKFTATVIKRTNGALEMKGEHGQTFFGTDSNRHITNGDVVNVFVRPESVRIAHQSQATENLSNTGQGYVQNILFNGANSSLLIQDQLTGATIQVALPQTGEFRDLDLGDLVYFGWESDQTRVYQRLATQRLATQ